MKRRNFLTASITAALGLTLQPARTQAQARPMALLTGFDPDGRPVDLARLEGKVCLVSFFTSGCNLCVHDLKLMREFYNDNRARNFVLIAVNLDESKSDYLAYTRLIEITVPEPQRFPILWRRETGHADSFGNITQQPTHFALDRHHRIEFKRSGPFQPDDWDRLWDMLN